MKIKSKVSIHCGEDGVWVVIDDSLSGLPFLRCFIPASDFMAMVGGKRNVEVDMEIHNLDKIGKTLEHKTFIFEMPLFPGLPTLSTARTVARDYVKRICPEGWKPDLHFLAKDSFFLKDGKRFAKTELRRWVKINDNESGGE